jgi:hypothetical protein
MTGIRIQLTNPDVKILRIHPTRNYDLDSVAYGDSLGSSLSVSGSGPVGATPVTVSGNRNSSIQAEERQRFITRVGKMSSFADASRHIFGWDFYPSNPYVSHVGVLEYLGRLFFTVPKVYNISYYLEGGARDCYVVLLLPPKFKGPSIDGTISTFYAHIDPDGCSGSETYTDHDLPIKIAIPEFSPWEEVAARPVDELKHPVSPALDLR